MNGAWTITISGSGHHHNSPKAYFDADTIMRRMTTELIRAGQTIDQSDFHYHPEHPTKEEPHGAIV